MLISSGMVAVNSQFLYISRTTATDSQIFGYSINQTDGTLMALTGSPFFFGRNLSFFGLVATPNGRFLYVPDVNQIDALSVDSMTGIPSIIPGSPFAAAGDEQLTVDPSGQFLYVSDGEPPGGISAFTISPNGALTPMPGSPFVIPNQTVANSEPYGIVDTGKFVYVSLLGSNQIAAFSIDNSTGVLTPVPGSPFPAETRPAILTFTGKFLYVINATDGSISGYAIDSNSGALTPIPGFPFGSQNTYFVIDHSGKYMYVSQSSVILSWNINPITGALTPGAEDFPYDGDGSLWLTIVQLPLPPVQ
ncbi:MAG TPA: beta-propeller fold lactonase family protein [Candidatus Acidoferrales bacterium]|nr:beta-propeller fold lactonase family protein [Candidatus Acidoferrales bacterium]